GNTWTLTKIRVRLAMRNRTFLFFSLLMPLGFLFFFVMVFSKGEPAWTAYILGAILTMTVMGSFWGLSVQLVMFREAGILRRFRLAPLGAGPMLASSILANYILVIPSVVIEILVTKFVLHMQGWGNLWAIFLLVTIGSATFSSFGLIVASVTNTMQETQVINQVIWTAFLFLSGATVPLARFPHWIQGASLFMPATYLATGLENAATNLATNGEILTDLIALTIGVLVAFEISRQLFRWEPEAKLPGSAKLWVVVAMIPFVAFGTYENVKGDRLMRIRQDFQMMNRTATTAPPAKSH
ncbi:MAG TPA: ABC transporter permease, partial [Candidatus Acidoferrales bacterium]|nr:ABC transporter permease [Candidatus Acidoferrales bacterium]